MGKVKKVHLKNKKVKAEAKAASTTAPSNDVFAAGTGNTRRELKKRHTQERKTLQAEIADLKRQRKKLPKKGSKDDKKELTREIKKMESELREKQKAELDAVGGAGAEEDDDDEEAEDAMSAEDE